VKFLFYFLQIGLLCLPCSPSLGQQNICIDSTTAPEETTIAFSTINPANMVAGANITRNYYSHDTGRTWNSGYMKSPYGVWGDPIVTSDTAGNFYFFHLSTPADGHWLDRMVCQKSTDTGRTWSDGSFVGINGEKNQDKPGVALDLTNSKFRNHIYLAWTQFDHYESAAPKDSSRILFSSSADGAITWSTPVRIDTHAGDCLDGDNTVEGAIRCVGPEGQVYVSWGGPDGLVFNKSIDGGKTWLPKQQKIEPIIGGWDYDITGIDRTDGLPITCCDISNGPNRGTIYINWSDQRNGKDNTDIWLVKSTDEGNTWSKPIRVNNDDGSSQQFMSWLSVDRQTGYLYCLFYDRRNHKGDTTDVYLAVSKDGGNSFINFRINERSFVPTSIDFFGDYICVQSYNEIVRPLWMQLQNHKLSIWTALLNNKDLDWAFYQPNAGAPATRTNEKGTISENKSLWFNYNLDSTQHVNLSIIDLSGKVVCSLYTNKRQKGGRHEYILNQSEHPLAPGSYAYKLDTESGSLYKPIVIY
jgi:hypothetical protein